jgi:hypothetical protein
MIAKYSRTSLRISTRSHHPGKVAGLVAKLGPVTFSP